MNKAQSFEVTEYGNAKKEYDRISMIKQIIQERAAAAPNMSVVVSFSGNMFTLHYHVYEMLVPTRMKEIESNAHDTLNACVKYIKKEFKARTKDTLTFKELKDLANYTIQKVSLNERYYVVYWRCYEFGDIS